MMKPTNEEVHHARSIFSLIKEQDPDMENFRALVVDKLIGIAKDDLPLIPFKENRVKYSTSLKKYVA